MQWAKWRLCLERDAAVEASKPRRPDAPPLQTSTLWFSPLAKIKSDGRLSPGSLSGIFLSQQVHFVLRGGESTDFVLKKKKKEMDSIQI